MSAAERKTLGCTIALALAIFSTWVAAAILGYLWFGGA